MSNFIYAAKNQQGQTQTGHLEAVNKRELAGILRNQDLVLISAEIAGEPEVQKRLEKFLQKIRLWSNISLVERMVFSRHLSVMIGAGLSLTQALKVLREQTKNHKFKKIINQLEIGIRQGESFSNTLAKHPAVFNSIYVNMVKVGEIGGNLNEVLKILAEQMRKDHELISRVRGAMIYPAVIVTAMIGIGIMMMIMVVPKLTDVFTEMNIELPMATRIIIGLSNFLKNNSILGLITLASLVILIRLIIKIPSVRKILHQIYLSFPIFGALIKKINSARFARTLSSLIESGVSIVESLKIVAGTLNNIHFKNALLDCAQRVQKGEALSSSLTKHQKLYLPMIIQMVSVGEETGSLNEVLDNLADFYEEEIDNTTKNLSAILEPVIMIIIGAAIGFFAVSMIQPMYSMMGGI